MITYKVGGVLHIPKTWNFPSGEVGVNVHHDANSARQTLVEIRASLTTSDEVMKLLMITDALRRLYRHADLDLVLGYVPYGRQDRVCNQGDSLSVRVFADLINSQNYKQVTIFDPHSDVTSAVINNAEVFSQCTIFGLMFNSSIPLDERDVIIAPDAGACKKTSQIFEKYQFKSMATAEKHRDMETGLITKLTFTGDVRGKHCVIVDDICDGGATFLALGRELRWGGAKSIKLFVTHGVFSKGTEELRSVFDKVYSTNSYDMSKTGVVDGVEYKRVI